MPFAQHRDDSGDKVDFIARGKRKVSKPRDGKFRSEIALLKIVARAATIKWIKARVQFTLSRTVLRQALAFCRVA